MYYAVILLVNSEPQLREISGLSKETAIKVFCGGGAAVCLCWAEGEVGWGRDGEKEGRWSFQFSKVK